MSAGSWPRQKFSDRRSSAHFTLTQVARPCRANRTFSTLWTIRWGCSYLTASAGPDSFGRSRAAGRIGLISAFCRAAEPRSTRLFQATARAALLAMLDARGASCLNRVVLHESRTCHPDLRFVRFMLDDRAEGSFPGHCLINRFAASYGSWNPDRSHAPTAGGGQAIILVPQEVCVRLWHARYTSGSGRVLECAIVGWIRRFRLWPILDLQGWSPSRSGAASLWTEAQHAVLAFKLWGGI